MMEQELLREEVEEEVWEIIKLIGEYAAILMEKVVNLETNVSFYIPLPKVIRILPRIIIIFVMFCKPVIPVHTTNVLVYASFFCFENPYVRM